MPAKSAIDCRIWRSGKRSKGSQEAGRGQALRHSSGFGRFPQRQRHFRGHFSLQGSETWQDFACGDRAIMNTGAMDGWPFPSDFRDPNEAWDLQGKLMFFALYTGFWACVVLAVFLYTRLRSRCSCRRRARSPARRQSSGFDDVSKMSEAFGEMPAFPESKARQKQRGHAFFGSPAQVAKICNVQVHELFLEQAKLTPTATALVLPHEAKTVVTYQELFGFALQLSVSLLDAFRSREPRTEAACLLGEELAEAVRQLAAVLEQLGPPLTVKGQLGKSAA